MADEQFFNDKRNDLDGDGYVDEKDINIMAHSAAAQAKVERNMNEDVSVYNLRQIYKKNKEKNMDTENKNEKSPEEKLRDKVIAHEESPEELMAFNAGVKEGKFKELSKEEKELKLANKEMKEAERAFEEPIYSNDKEEEVKEDRSNYKPNFTIPDAEEINKAKDKKVDEEEIDNKTKDKKKTVDNEEEVDNKAKASNKKIDEEVDNKSKGLNKEKEPENNLKEPSTSMAQSQNFQPQQGQMYQRAPSAQRGQEAINTLLDGASDLSLHLGGTAFALGTLAKGLGLGASSIFQKLKENYNGEEFRPPEETKAIGNGIANNMQNIVEDLPPEFNNAMTRSIINSFRLTPERDANVNKDDKGDFIADVMQKPKDIQTEMTETMIKDRVVNESSMGLLGALHLAGGTTKDKDGQIVLKDEIYTSLEGKLDKKEVAALGASLYAVNNYDKLDTSNKHINSVVEIAKGFNDPEALEKSLSVMYQASGREAASNPERNAEGILVSPANIVTLAQTFKDSKAIDTKAFDKQLDAVTKGIKEVNQVNHTIVSRDASKSTQKILDFIQEREQNKGMDKGHDKERKQER